MYNRITFLEGLLNFSSPLDQILKHIRALPWDSDEELVLLDLSHIRVVLQKYLLSELTGHDVEIWANAIEGREDIGIKEEGRDLLQELLFEMANPDLTQQFTFRRAKELLQVIPT